MFLSKRNGIYYIWYRDVRDKKRKVSTGATVKIDALRFLRSFAETSHINKPRVFCCPISSLNYSSTFASHGKQRRSQ